MKNLTLQKLLAVGSQVGSFFKAGDSIQFDHAKDKTNKDLKQPGFYFVVIGKSAVFRTYVGNQLSKSKIGFSRTICDVKYKRTSNAGLIHDAIASNIKPKVIYVHNDDMKCILLQDKPSKLHNVQMMYNELQNMHETNVRLAKIYKFKFQ